MTDSMKDQLAEDLEKVKTQGAPRASRIGEIVKTAASQVFAELKEGSGEIGAIAKNRLSTVTETLNSKAAAPTDGTTSETPAEAAGEWTGSTFSHLILGLFNLIKQSLGGLDATLNERHGDRYQSAKQRLDQTATWYRTTMEKAKATKPEPTKVDQKQAELADKAAELGTTAAQREQQILQQVREFVQPSTEKH